MSVTSTPRAQDDTSADSQAGDRRSHGTDRPRLMVGALHGLRRSGVIRPGVCYQGCYRATLVRRRYCESQRFFVHWVLGSGKELAPLTRSEEFRFESDRRLLRNQRTRGGSYTFCRCDRDRSSPVGNGSGNKGLSGPVLAGCVRGSRFDRERACLSWRPRSCAFRREDMDSRP
jgi:hypothetical protein